MAIDSCVACEYANRHGDIDKYESVCRVIQGLVATALGISLTELQAHSRGRAAAAFARQTAMYLAHVHFGISLSQVGRTFGRDRTTVAHACARVEDRRDDPKFECILGCLESALDGWQRGFLFTGVAA
jgi:chromosomal replication initiation ATPase DnaA